jgi:hypothetical protein
MLVKLAPSTVQSADSVYGPVYAATSLLTASIRRMKKAAVSLRHTQYITL